MRLVHLSDTHLGYHRYLAQSADGVNQRELDVDAAFVRAIDRIILIAPDLVLLTGDLFERSRPTNHAILHAFAQLGRLRDALPDAPVIITAGDHDQAFSKETTSVLPLFESLGCYVVSVPRRLTFPALGVSVLGIPGRTAALATNAERRTAFTTDPTARFNVIAMHGSVEALLPAEASDVTERWDYVALGHYHVHRTFTDGVSYAGSLEYTSPNVWGELLEERLLGLPGKGIVERDLATRTQRFHHIPGSRRHIDMAPIAGAGCTAAELEEVLAAALERVELEGNIVRCRVLDVPRHARAELLHAKVVKQARKRACAFQLDVAVPQRAVRMTDGSVMSMPERVRRPSLVEYVRTRLETRELGSDIDRAALIAISEQYLEQAGDGLTVPEVSAQL